MFDGAYLFIVGFCFAIAICALLFSVYQFYKKYLAKEILINNRSGSLIKDFFTLQRIKTITIIIIIAVSIVTGLLIYENINTISLKARFRDVGMLGKGSDVIYRGVNIGKVTSISLSKDSEYAIVTFKIPVKDPVIYEGSTAEISFRSITGAQALVIKPPFVIRGKKPLSQLATIEGKDSITVEETQKLIAKMIEEGKLEYMINNLSQLLKNTNEISSNLNKLNNEKQDDIRDFLKSSAELSKSLKQTSDSVNVLLTKTNASQEIKIIKEIKTLISQTSKLIEQTNSLVVSSNSLVSSVDKTVNNPESKVNLKSSMQKFDDILTDIKDISGDQEIKGDLKQSVKNMSVVISDIKDITEDKEVKENLKKTIIESGESISKINCFSQEIGNTLSKRFLIPRLIIGKPAGNINSCFEEEIIEK
ncbi:MAG: MlaD family protein [Cyanobacteriota bacterium]